MKVLGIEHVGIAVENFDIDAPFWKMLFQNCAEYDEEVTEQKVNTKIFDTSRGKIELLEATDENSPIAKFINKRGKGIHHICMQVENIEESISELISAGVVMIDSKPRIGAEGYKIAFIHPKSTGGVLVELAEKS